jgi:NADH:ubiquinone oxidoreductase subunit 6 (subunit J)
MSEVIFFIAAISAIIGAVGVVTLRNPLYAVLALVCHLVALAALFLLLRAEFVAAAQVVVYAGAVMVLYVFVVAYIGGGEDQVAAGSALRVLGPLFAVALAIELFIAMLGTALKGVDSQGAPYKYGFGTPEHIGRLFLTTYLFAFELASLLLLVAAIGAVVLARRRRGLEDDDGELARVLSRPRPAYTGTIAEGVGVRKVRDQMEHSHGGVFELAASDAAAERGPEGTVK